MSKIKSIILTFAIALTALISYVSSASDTQVMSQKQLLKHMAEPSSDVIVLDVRSKGEYEEGHIDGALNVSHTEIEDNLSLLANLNQYKDKTIVVHCRSGYRAGKAEAILTENGFTKLRHLEGDMNGWLKAELPTVK